MWPQQVGSIVFLVVVVLVFLFDGGLIGAAWTPLLTAGRALPRRVSRLLHLMNVTVLTIAEVVAIFSSGRLTSEAQMNSLGMPVVVDLLASQHIASFITVRPKQRKDSLTG